MKQLSPQARRLFDLARDQDGPDAQGEARVRRALLARLALGASIQGIGGAVARAAAAGAKTTVVFKFLVAAGVGGAMVAGTEWVARGPMHGPLPLRASAAQDAGARPGMHSPIPEALPPQPTIEALPETVPEPNVHTPDVHSGAPRRPSPRWGDSPDPLQVETDALRSAQLALRDGDPKHALRLLDEQDAKFSAGILGEERAAARVLALSQEGNSERACIEARAFERHWPRSALLVRVRSACRSP